MESSSAEILPIESETRKRDRKKVHASCVYFTEDQYTEIHSDSVASGLSVPHLLKNAYFPNRRVRILMPKEEQERWIKELRHWGNNLNQLAKRVNAGFLKDWYPEFSLIKSSIDRVEKMVLGIYGSRQV